MHIIIITAPAFLPDEAQILSQLLKYGLYRLHLRKPDCTENQMETLIRQIPSTYYSRISLHDHFHLQARYHLGGIHLNSRNPNIPTGYQGLLSRSCHTIEEAIHYSPLTDYYFLSPIFDSISKRNYYSGFTDVQLRQASKKGIIQNKTIALGGISANKLPYLSSLGFGGAAFMGDIWKDYHSSADIPHTVNYFQALIMAAKKML